VGKKQRIQRDRAAVLGRLQALCDQVPAIPDCDGRCWRSCGPIDMSDAERSRLEKSGMRISRPEEAARQLELYYCEALKDGKCTRYKLRPLICHLWGATEGMKCPYGCVPEGGWLTDAKAQELIAESLRIGGHPAAQYLPAPGDMAAAVKSPVYQRVLAAANVSCQGAFAVRDEDSIPAGFRRQLPVIPSGDM
jgi:hypothetical protein